MNAYLPVNTNPECSVGGEEWTVKRVRDVRGPFPKCRGHLLLLPVLQ